MNAVVPQNYTSEHKIHEVAIAMEGNDISDIIY